MCPVRATGLDSQHASPAIPLGRARAAHERRAVPGRERRQTRHRGGEREWCGVNCSWCVRCGAESSASAPGLDSGRAGDKIGYSGSFISDIERCERSPSVAFAQRCDGEMGVPGTFVRVQELTRREACPSWFYPVIPLEREAVRIHAWELGSVPGLLQTEEYARAHIRSGRPQDSDDDIDRLVAARLGRQEILTGDHAPLLCCGQRAPGR